MSAPLFVVQQPRWVILSVFLFLWSVSSAVRREGRARALGLGVEGRIHIPAADIMVDTQGEHMPDALWKRQVAIPDCAVICASRAGDAVGCGEGLNLGCACHSPTFLPNTVTCMDKNCTSIDEQLGQEALQSACLAIGTSTTSSSSTKTTFSVSSTSITSGPVPICTTVSPTPSSGATTVSVTVTVTSGSGAPTNSNTAPSTPSPSSSDAATTASIPVVTTTTLVTSSSTVLQQTSSSADPPVSTVTSTSTSTIGSIPTGSGSGAEATGTDQNGAAAAGAHEGVVGAVLAALVGIGTVLVM